MTSSLLGMLGRALRDALGKIARAGFSGLVLGVALVEGLALAFNHGAGAAPAVAWTWPPQVNLAVFTVFVHILAGVVGVLLGSLLAFGVAVTQTLKGVIFAAEHVDDAAGAIVDRGLDVVDAAVDAVDGPDRHGFRGKRGAVPAR